MVLTKQTTWIFTLFLLGSSILIAQLRSPSEFLPTRYKTDFTPHHLLVDYFDFLTENSDQIKLFHIGRTNQKRPQIIAVISSKENIQNLESIRKNHLGQIGWETAASSDKAVVWLGYSVHGNEPSGSESSMQVAYHLLTDPQAQEYLKNTIVLLEPSTNPDGYSRYTHWINGVGGKNPNPDLNDVEHNEPWPGGRPNHYLFDLNRDWAWQTQVESQNRMKFYQKWYPHIVADLHEMGINSSYYFAPAAKPYHPLITQFQRDFQTEIGKNHAKYFDQNHWLYFTKEVFDLYYPSYGDTYPTYNGAIGMTYEQAGHSRGGRAANLNNRQILTLEDRINHHFTTSLSTIEMGAKNRSRLIEKQTQFFSKKSKSKYNSYVLRNENENKTKALTNLLDKLKIEYGFANQNTKSSGYSYQTTSSSSVNIRKGDIVVPTQQKKGVLTSILFEPQQLIPDSLSYDITSWVLPYAYGIESYAVNKSVAKASQNPIQNSISTADGVAFAIDWNSVESAEAVSHLLSKGYTARVATKPFSQNGKTYNRGTVVVSKSDNVRNADQLLGHINTARKITPIDALSTTWSDSGPDVASSAFNLLTPPKVAVLYGDRVDNHGYGQVKYYFEQKINYPFTAIKKTQLNNVLDGKYDVIVLTDGYYSLGEEELKKVNTYVRKGGKVIAVAYGNSSLLRSETFALSTPDEVKEDEVKAKLEIAHYHQNERKAISNYLAGAVVGVKMDTSHPLAFGMGDTYFSLKTNELAAAISEDIWNVGHLPQNYLRDGFIGHNVKENLKEKTIFAVEDIGRGQVVYLLDNPLFRGFWHNGFLLFSNAVFQVN